MQFLKTPLGCRAKSTSPLCNQNGFHTPLFHTPFLYGKTVGSHIHLSAYNCAAARPAANTHYDTLGISRAASASEIKAAYLKKAKEFHPDLNHSNKEQATRLFLETQKAYEVLKDSGSRTYYDYSINASSSSSTSFTSSSTAYSYAYNFSDFAETFHTHNQTHFHTHRANKYNNNNSKKKQRFYADFFEQEDNGPGFDFEGDISFDIFEHLRNMMHKKSRRHRQRERQRERRRERRQAKARERRGEEEEEENELETENHAHRSHNRQQQPNRQQQQTQQQQQHKSTAHNNSNGKQQPHKATSHSNPNNKYHNNKEARNTHDHIHMRNNHNNSKKNNKYDKEDLDFEDALFGEFSTHKHNNQQHKHGHGDKKGKGDKDKFTSSGIYFKVMEQFDDPVFWQRVFGSEGSYHAHQDRNNSGRTNKNRRR